MTTIDEVDVLNSAPTIVTLESGFRVSIQRLKTRQLMRGMKILSHGAGDALGQIVSADADATEFAGAILGALVFSIPDAEDETIDFIQSMCIPADLIETPRLPDDEQKNIDAWAKFQVELDNPELDDMISIIEKIVETEAPHLMALGKRLALLIEAQTKSLTAKQKRSSKQTSKA